MNRYYVISPEYAVCIPVTDDGQGPMEPCADVVEVEAASKADARVFGLKLLRARPAYHDWRGWLSDNDFRGLRVEAWQERQT